MNQIESSPFMSTAQVATRIASAPSPVTFDEREQVNGLWWGADVMPLGLARFLVELISEPAQTILDPFGGVGTTGRAAIAVGRKFIGFETDGERYRASASCICEDFRWFNCVMNVEHLAGVTPDVLLTSPPFGRSVGDKRVFDDAYFGMMEASFRLVGSVMSRQSIAMVEMMNWPEYDGGSDLLFRLHSILSAKWSFIREIAFVNKGEGRISRNSSHTWLTFWHRKSGGGRGQ